MAQTKGSIFVRVVERSYLPCWKVKMKEEELKEIFNEAYIKDKAPNANMWRLFAWKWFKKGYGACIMESIEEVRNE